MSYRATSESDDLSQLERKHVPKAMIAIIVAIMLGAFVIMAPASTFTTVFIKESSAPIDPDTMSVTYALQATGISSATVEPVEDGDANMVVPTVAKNVDAANTDPTSEPSVEDLDSCYVMFAVDPNVAADELPATGPSNNKDTVLAKIASDGSVSIVSFERDILPQVRITKEETEQVSQAYASTNRSDIRTALEQAGKIKISFYATVDSRYLYELKSNLDELVDSGVEWKAHLDAKAEAERLAAEEAAKPKTVIDDNLWFNQNDFAGQYYQDYFDIPGYGCGLCSTTVILDMLFDEKWDPVYVAHRMQDYSNSHGHIQYCVWAGTSYPQWATVVSNEFGVDIRKATSVEDAKQALSEGKMIFAGNGGAVFLDSNLNKHWHDGHIICFYKTDGSSVWAKDPAGCGGASVQYSATDFQQWWDWGGSNRMYIVSRAGE